MNDSKNLSKEDARDLAKQLAGHSYTAFATGVFVRATLINGKVVWIADGFEDDTFYNGVTIDPDDKELIAALKKELQKKVSY